MRRRLFTILSAMSLLLCVATVVLWVRSYWKSDAVTYFSPSGERAVQCARGAIVIRGNDLKRAGRSVEFDSWPETDWRFSTIAPTSFWERIGFGFESATEQLHVSYLTFPPAGAKVLVPIWAVLLAFGILPLVRALSAVRKRRRQRPGTCQACGYDLRATPDRCPECGTVPAGSAESA